MENRYLEAINEETHDVRFSEHDLLLVGGKNDLSFLRRLLHKFISDKLEYQGYHLKDF